MVFSQRANSKFTVSLSPLIAWSAILKADLVIISPLSAGTMLCFVTSGKSRTLKEEGASLVSSPLSRVGFHSSPGFCSQDLATPAASAGASSPNTHGFSSVWQLLQHSAMESKHQSLQDSRRQAAFPRTSSSDFRVEGHRLRTSP